MDLFHPFNYSGKQCVICKQSYNENKVDYGYPVCSSDCLKQHLDMLKKEFHLDG